MLLILVGFACFCQVLVGLGGFLEGFGGLTAGGLWYFLLVFVGLCWCCWCSMVLGEVWCFCLVLVLVGFCAVWIGFGGLVGFACFYQVLVGVGGFLEGSGGLTGPGGCGIFCWCLLVFVGVRWFLVRFGEGWCFCLVLVLVVCLCGLVWFFY